jgi:diguanylate cyclase (GGDEF)-like protein
MGGTGATELRERAEQVRSAVSCLPFPTAHGMIAASVSMGAITIEDWDKSLPIEPFLKEADDALYRAKAAGRDRIIYTVASSTYA